MPIPIRGGPQYFFQKAVFISTGDYQSVQNTTGSIVQLSRITDANWDIRFPVKQNTYLDAGNESYLSSYTPVDLTVGWYHTNGLNEMYVGLVNDFSVYGPGSGASGWVFGTNFDQSHNIYITAENSPGVDAVGASGVNQTKTVLAFGNAYLNSYQIGVRVGSIIESSAAFSCLSMFIYSGATGNQIPGVGLQSGNQLTGLFALPAASSQYFSQINTGEYSASAISARDMIVVFPATTPFGVALSGQQMCYLQSISASFSLNRTEIKPLGYVFPAYRPIQYPVEVGVTTQMVVSQYQQDQIQRIGCLSTGQSVYIIVKQPCSNETLFGLYFDNLQIVSESFNTSVGGMDTCSISWKGIMSNPYQTFFAPNTNFLINADTSGAYGLNW